MVGGGSGREEDGPLKELVTEGPFKGLGFGNWFSVEV